MHLRLVIVSLVVIAFTSLVLGGTTKSTTKKPGTTKKGATVKRAAAKITTAAPLKFDCVNALSSIFDCTSDHHITENYRKYLAYKVVYNISGLTTFLKGLKDSGCIAASAWSDVKAWLALYTPPICFMNIINGLTEEQRNAMMANSDMTFYDENVRAVAEKANKIIKKKVKKLKGANKKAYNNWSTKLTEACEPYYMIGYSFVL